MSAPADGVFAALADPTRWRVLSLLAERGEGTATSLAGELPVSRVAVVKHLAVLDRAGLVEGRREGREVRYTVRTEPLGETARWMADVASQWDARLAAIKRMAEDHCPRRHLRRQGDQMSTVTPNPRRWWALALLCGAFFMVILDANIVIVALPSIEADLGFSEQGLQWVVSAYALTFAGLLLLGGRAADLLGRRRVFMVGLAASSRSPRSSAGSPGRPPR